MLYFVYVLASRRNGTLYIGVTNNLAARVTLHRQGKGSKFVAKYKVHRLVHMEAHDEVRSAIQREKTLKEWPRAWKLRLIERGNPNWDDLFETLNH